MLFRKLAGSQGMTFGVMDGVITVLGVLAGLFVLGDKGVVIAGMLIAGMADSLANAVGIHVSQETEGAHSRKDIMMSTIMAFLSTFIVTLILVFPHGFFSLYQGTLVSIFLGLLLILGVGYFVAKRLEKDRRGTAILMIEYLGMALLVVGLSSVLGMVVRDLFGVVYA
jgi:hypothetical protein